MIIALLAAIAVLLLAAVALLVLILLELERLTGEASEPRRDDGDVPGAGQVDTGFRADRESQSG